MLSWLRRRRRRRILSKPFPAAWREILIRYINHYPLLTTDEQQRFERDLQIFVAEKNWEGCNGLQLTDEMRVVIAGWACLLLLNIEHDYFSHVQSILLYPDSYLIPEIEEGGFVVTSQQLLGEAHYRGPVILSWRSVRRAGRGKAPGHNVVLHEFAHQLDMLDRSIDGTPPLGSRADYQAWAEVMSEEYQRLADDWRSGRDTVLDPYGTSNEAEFFAVATEAFFGRPQALASEHASLYDLLKHYYRQDPAARLSDPPLRS